MTPKPRVGATGTAADPARQSTRPQKDEAGSALPGTGERNPSYSGMKLPHERDESAEPDTGAQRNAQGTRPIIEQGAQDIASGLQDTDRYNTVAVQHDAVERGSDNVNPKPRRARRRLT